MKRNVPDAGVPKQRKCDSSRRFERPAESATPYSSIRVPRVLRGSVDVHGHDRSRINANL